MCKGEGPIGSAKGKQTNTMASCQPPPPPPPSATPSAVLQVLWDGHCASGYQEPWDLAACVWGAGPVVKTLRTVLDEGTAPRVYPRVVGCRSWRGGATKAVLHMPIGSAIHLSSVAEPVMQLYKQAGVMETDLAHLAIRGIVRAGLGGGVSPAVLRRVIDRTKWRTVSVFHMTGPAQVAWNRSLPWVMRENPEYFCFELPDGLPQGRSTAPWVLWAMHPDTL